MSHLTKANQEIATTNDHPLFQPAVCNEDMQTVFNVVIAAIAKSFFDLNYKNPDAATKSYMAHGLTRNIIKNFPSMRISEIPVAFANGIRGKYGEYFGLNIISFEKFIAAYLQSDERKRLIEEKNKIVIEPPKEPTADQKFDTAKMLLMEAYEAYKVGKFIDRTALTNYDFIARIELVNYTKEEKKQFMADAERIVPDYYEKEQINSTELWKRRQIGGQLATFKECLEKALPFPEDQKLLIKTIAKKLALKAFLEDSLLEGSDLAELIEAKRAFYN